MGTCPACSSPCDEGHRFCPTCGFPIGQVAKQPADPLLGRSLPGGYTVLELVGVGGMGRVYRAEQQVLGRTVAVKIIHGHLLSDESASARFITEARAASQLNHPNSVGVIDFGTTEDGLLYLVMEFLRGRDLARVLNESGLLPLRRSVEVIRQVLAALAEAHELGIIHRDLKPENIILEPRRGGGDYVKVVDFGLAKVRAERSVTRPGIVCGTPDYMAPEQGRGDALDGRSDLYSVGVILFLLLTGRLPFEGDSPTQVVLLHLTMPPPDPRQVAPGRALPDALVEVCMRALSKDPDKRYADADAFARALVESLELPPQIEGSSPGEVIVCAACGSPNLIRQKFCGECGVKLGGAGSGDNATRRPRLDLVPELASKLAGRTQQEMPLPLKNRAGDLGWLEERLGEVRGALVAVRVLGEEGAGKSRLLDEFAREQRRRGATAVIVGADPWWADVGYWTLRALIRSLGQLPASGGEAAQWVGASAEARRGLSEVFRSSGESELQPEETRYLVAEALRWALGRGAKLAGDKQRLVVLIDDLHRVDGASRHALADVLSEPLLAPVLLVAVQTPGFEAGWGATLRVLNLLPSSTVAELFDGTAMPPPSDSRGVLPLFAEHLLRFARDGGTDPPARLVDLLGQRLEHVSTEGRRALQVVAVLGEPVRAEDIEPLLDDKAPVGPVLAKLAQRGLISLDDSGAAQVAHPLLREVVMAMIPVAARHDLHAAAQRRAQRKGHPTEVQALYAALAGDSFQALLLLDHVAAQAHRRGDSEGSTLALRRALEVARQELFRGELDDPAEAVVLFSIKLADALCQQGNFTDADGVLREALDLATPSGVDRAKVLRGLAQVARGRAREAEAAGYLRKAIEIATRSGERELVRSLESLR